MNDVVFNCPTCQNRLKGKFDFGQHLISHLSPSISLSVVKTYKLMITAQKIHCPVEHCAKTFNSQTQALLHIARMHDL